MREEIIFAGFGGQGIMFMGKALSYSAMNQGKFVTWMPSYGAEVRGGTAHSMVVISDNMIASPVVRKPSICAAMNKPSFDKFGDAIQPEGLLVVNSSLVNEAGGRNDIDRLDIPATDMAFELGNIRAANMIILGALLARRSIVPLSCLAESLKEMLPGGSAKLLSLNREAVKKGYEYGSR